MSETALRELEGQAATIAARIPLIAIMNAESFRLAVEDRAEIKRRLARIDELMQPICDTAYKAWKTAVGKRDGLKAPFVEADKVYSRAMGTWEQEQQRQRRAAEEAAQRERERLEAEERTRVAAEQARLQREAEDRQLAEAAAAEQRGDAEAAAAIKVLDTLRNDFSQLRHVADGKEFAVTFSCGIADVTQFPDAKKLSDAADKALYKAKHAGRNQVAQADDPSAG